MKSVAAVLVAAAVPLSASAYCIQNELADRDVLVTQEAHPDDNREHAKLKATIKPGGMACCQPANLDCNPNGRHNSLVGLAVFVSGEPAWVCGSPNLPASARLVKVHGAGTMRIVDNPRYDAKAKAAGASPYIVRLAAPDNKDLTGPAGLPCRQP